MRWRPIDFFALLPVLTFSVSYGLTTDFKGFYHRLGVLCLDWAAPYMFARSVLRTPAALTRLLRSIAFSATLLAFFAVYECRMATRILALLWHQLVPTLDVLPHLGYWRWGFMRAVATFGEPIALGVFFATATLLACAWASIEPRRARAALFACTACLAGCIATLSRGPIASVVAVLLGYWAVTRKRWILVAVLLGIAAVAAPFVVDFAKRVLVDTQTDLTVSGNTSSGQYRLALFLIYGKSIADVSFFGDPTLVGAEYEQAWSLDNSYLYLLILGGWVGGGSFLGVLGVNLFRSGALVLRTEERRRKTYGALLAGHIAIVVSMTDVWFSPTFAPLFWLTMGLIAFPDDALGRGMGRPAHAGTTQRNTMSPGQRQSGSLRPLTQQTREM